MLVTCALACSGGMPNGSTDASTDGSPQTMDASADVADGGDSGVIAVPLTGCYETHTLPVTIGAAQTFHLNLDTGASTLGVAATTCAACASAGVTPLYSPGEGATDLMKPETLMYAPGFGWSGEAWQDAVSIGGLATPVDLVAIASESSYFYSGDCDTPTGTVPGPYEGTIGFGIATDILPGTNEYFDQLVSTNAIPDVFAVSFCHVDGTLWLGGYDPASIATPLVYTPMGMGDGYTVEWTDVTVGNSDIQLPVGVQAMTDSGGNYMFVPSGLYTQIASALESNPAFAATFGPSFFSATAQPRLNCMTSSQTPAQIDAALPPFTLKLGVQSPIEVSLGAAESYLSYTYLGPSEVSYCQNLLVAAPTSFVQYYLGMSLMLGHVLVHDRAHAQFGIAPVAQACPF